MGRAILIEGQKIMFSRHLFGRYPGTKHGFYLEGRDGLITLRSTQTTDFRIQNLGFVIDNVASIGWYNSSGTRIERIISLDEYDSFVIRGGSPGISENPVRYVTFDMLGYPNSWNQVWRIWDETPADTDYSDPGSDSDLPSPGQPSDILVVYRDYLRDSGAFDTFVKLFAPLAESKSTANIRNSPHLVWISRYWDGSQSQDAEAFIKFDLTSTSPLAGHFVFSLLGNTRLMLNTDGNLLPGSDNTQDIGNSSLGWRDLYLRRSLRIDIPSSIGDGGNYIAVLRGDLASNEPVFWLHEEVVDSSDDTGQITHLQVRGPIHAYIAKDITANSGYTPYLDLADVNWSFTVGLGASGNLSTDTCWLYFSWVYGTGSYTEVARIDSTGFLQVKSGLTTMLGGAVNVPTDKTPLYLAVTDSHETNILEIVRGSTSLLKVSSQGNILCYPQDTISVGLYMDFLSDQSARYLEINKGGNTEFAVNSDASVYSKTGYIVGSHGMLKDDGVNLVIDTEGYSAECVSKGKLRPFSDLTYDLGASNYRWNVVYAGSIASGDYVFANNWKLTEDEKYGVVLESPEGRRYRFLLEEIPSSLSPFSLTP